MTPSTRTTKWLECHVNRLKDVAIIIVLDQFKRHGIESNMLDDNHDEVEEDHDEVEDDHGAHLQVDLGWDSPLPWVTTAIFLDLGYYAFHRASHEVGPIIRVGW